MAVASFEFDCSHVQDLHTGLLILLISFTSFSIRHAAPTAGNHSRPDVQSGAAPSPALQPRRRRAATAGGWGQGPACAQPAAGEHPQPTGLPRAAPLCHGRAPEEEGNTPRVVWPPPAAAAPPPSSRARAGPPALTRAELRSPAEGAERWRLRIRPPAMEGKEEGPAARHSRSGVGEGGRRGREGAEGGRGQRVGGAPIQSPAREGEDRPRR
ncbi:translation initiation factor IF-2-like [Panicum virgatum]|uniref:translation initiation factor IF-2-like n=1 Tax=Panicum virgatum TaxID=38727 RepID=UPI0019D65EF0|nr:translation initiation factor IF-2-like [Panicum virgatum]